MSRTPLSGLILLALCLARPALADDPGRIPPATPPQVRQTVDRGIGYLRAESAAWLSQGKCAACHHVPLPLWALNEAALQGYAVDRTFVADTTEAALGGLQNMIASKVVPDPAGPPDPRPMARGVSLGAVFLAAAAGSAPALTEGQRQSLRLITADVLKKQQADGSWEFFLARPPIEESQATDTAWILMALQADAGPDAPEANRVALAKGRAWLAGAAAPDDRQVNALRVLVAVRAGDPRETMRATFDALAAAQRADGGWGQTAGAESDAFATGQTLYALAVAGYTADQSAIKRGVDYLVATQKPDGSWPMASRATPDGKPGGAKLLTPITSGASAWATMALARLAPNRP